MEIEYDKVRRIRRLVVVDERGKTVFEYPRERPLTAQPAKNACSLSPEDWEKIGYTEEQLQEVVLKRTGKQIGDLDEKECSRLREWIDKVYEKRLQSPFPENE